jgi:hypothetical protein
MQHRIMCDNAILPQNNQQRQGLVSIVEVLCSGQIMRCGENIERRGRSRYIAWLFWWQFVASLAWVLLTLVHFALTALSVCNISFAELLSLSTGFGGMCGENSCNVFLLLFMVVTLGSYLRDALQEGSADAMACLHVPRAQVFSSFLLFPWWSPLLFCKKV